MVWIVMVAMLVDIPKQDLMYTYPSGISITSDKLYYLLPMTTEHTLYAIKKYFDAIVNVALDTYVISRFGSIGT